MSFLYTTPFGDRKTGCDTKYKKEGEMKMIRNWKKTLAAAGVLATLLAGSAFAATEAEDAAIQRWGLEHNNKIEQQAPDMDKGHPPFGFHKDGHHRPGSRHDSFHKHHGGPGHNHGSKFHADKKHRPGKLTQEQRQLLAKEREQFFANWQSMSDRERREATEKFIHRVNEERMKNMTEAEKKTFEKRQAAKKAEREHIAKMTEDERHEYFKQKHDQMVKNRIKNMTKEEKERFLERDKRQQERMEAFWKKWKQMTPEEKEQWKKDHHRFEPGPRQGVPVHRNNHRPHDGQGPKAPRPA